jgi:hypothetical protein
VALPDKTFSQQENRNLAVFPELNKETFFSGEFGEQLNVYFADQFPFRDTFMSIKTKTDKLLGKKDINGVYLSKNDYLIEKYNTPKNSDKIIETLNEFNETVNYVNMNLLLAPTSIAINKDLIPKNAPTYDELETINYIYNKINFDTIDTYDILKEKNKDYQMYYRLDHHWTTFGAYYAYTKYAEANNITPYSLNSFDIKEVTNDFNGTLYSKSNDYTRKSDSIHTFTLKDISYEVNYVSKEVIKDTMYEDSYLTKKDKYSYFLDNNHPLIVITNKSINTKKELIVIKDSYANSMVPFLANHYKKVHVIDPRYYKNSISDYIKENKNIKDGLILYNVMTMDSDLGILGIK